MELGLPPAREGMQLDLTAGLFLFCSMQLTKYVGCRQASRLGFFCFCVQLSLPAPDNFWPEIPPPPTADPHLAQSARLFMGIGVHLPPQVDDCFCFGRPECALVHN